MKKIRIAALAAAIVLAVGATTAFAAGGRHHAWTGTGVCDRTGICWADADGDGVCDNCGRLQGVCYTDADGDGVCDNRGTGLGCRSGYGHHGCRW